jgi:hypothetical protein
MAAIRENIEYGNSVIATAPFIHELGDAAWIERSRGTFAGVGVSTEIVWVYCDASTMYTYLRYRDAARDNAKLSDWTKYVESIDIDL